MRKRQGQRSYNHYALEDVAEYCACVIVTGITSHASTLGTQVLRYRICQCKGFNKWGGNCTYIVYTYVAEEENASKTAYS